ETDITTIERSLKERGIEVVRSIDHPRKFCVIHPTSCSHAWLSGDPAQWGNTDSSIAYFPTREAAMRAAHATPLPWEVSPSLGETGSKLGDELRGRLADLRADLDRTYTPGQRALMVRIDECERLLESIGGEG